MFTVKMVAGQSNFCFHSCEQHEGWDCSSFIQNGIPVLAHVRCSINVGGMDMITPHATLFKYAFKLHRFPVVDGRRASMESNLTG